MSTSVFGRAIRGTRRAVGRVLATIGFGTVVVVAGSVYFGTNKLKQWRHNMQELKEIRSNVDKKFIIEIPLDHLVESKSPATLVDLIGLSSSHSLWELQLALESAKADPRVVGIVGTLKKGTKLDLGSIQELQGLISDFSNSGKETWSHTYGIMSSKDYLALSSFKTVTMQPAGNVYLPALTGSDFFLKRLFKSLGIEAQFIKRSEYKNAPNTFTEDDYTTAHLQSKLELMQNLQDEIVKGIAGNRGLTEAEVKQLQESALFLDKEALAAKLIDFLAHRNQIEYDFEQKKLVVTPIDQPPLSTTMSALTTSPLDQVVGIFRSLNSKSGAPATELKTPPIDEPKTPANPNDDPDAPHEQAIQSKEERIQAMTKVKASYTVPLQTYLKTVPLDLEPDIAVVFASGPISVQDGPKDSRQASITDQKMAKDLDKIRRMPSVKAVIIRINSPGGAADASETIWGEIKKTQASGKKVIVSMGDYAASGGYYMASPADLIMAQPGTITGSIGIFFGKFQLKELFQKLNINIGILSSLKGVDQHVPFAKEGSEDNDQNEQVEDNDNNVQEVRKEFLLSPYHEWTDAERKFLERVLESSYLHFKTRVAEGRKMSLDQVENVAKGRVWTGRQAQQLGLVDELGGLPQAIARTKAIIGKPDATANVVSSSTKKDILKNLLWSGAESISALLLVGQVGRQVLEGSRSQFPISAQIDREEWR